MQAIGFQDRRFRPLSHVSNTSAPTAAITNLHIIWCERRDSNSHALRRRNLNPVRLPIPPLSQYSGGDERNRTSTSSLTPAPQAGACYQFRHIPKIQPVVLSATCTRTSTRRCSCWSGRQDLNLRFFAPKANDLDQTSLRPDETFTSQNWWVARESNPIAPRGHRFTVCSSRQCQSQPIKQKTLKISLSGSWYSQALSSLGSV